MSRGLWKGKWEIHREDMERYFVEMDRRHDEWREEMRDVRGECKELRADYDRELAEARLFNRELLIRLEKTYANLGTTLDLMGRRMEILAGQVVAMGKELHESTDAVKAQTEAILRLVDRFEDTDGRPPV